MANRPTKKSTRQAPASVPRTATVELPLPLRAALEDAESGFLGLCIETGKQVLIAMMEEDRVALYGARGPPRPGSRRRSRREHGERGRAGRSPDRPSPPAGAVALRW